MYDIAQIETVDFILIVMKKRNFSSHKKIMAVEILSNDMGYSWDEEQAELCLVAWDMQAAQLKFHQWVNRNADRLQKAPWDAYSRYHLGVLVSVQHEVYSHVSSMVHGHVLDAGCGSARVMGYIQDNPRVNSYTGIDSSNAMIQQATWLKQQLAYENAELICSTIEEAGEEYDSIFSIHSFYTWTNPELTLRHINTLLKKDGTFILVTPNDHFDVQKLQRLVDREVLGHPYYKEFLHINQTIAERASYISMDALIASARNTGFTVQAASQDYFLGGASCLTLKRR